MERTAPANSRSTTRQKLLRLTKQQFQELSTDVYDELVRRKNSSENESPSLCLSFHFFCLSSHIRRSPLPARPRRLPSKTESSSSEAGHAAHHSLRRSVRRCPLRACSSISRVPRRGLLATTPPSLHLFIYLPVQQPAITKFIIRRRTFP